MNKKVIPLAVLGLIALGVIAYFIFGRDDRSDAIVLHGNVDLRQVDLPFNDSERIAEVLVEEGTAVKTGQVLARLETGRLVPRVRQA